MVIALPFHANGPTRADLFRQIFRDHFDRWCDLRLEDEVPADQRAYVRETVQRMMVCRDPEAGCARYECPGCGYELRMPFSCRSRFCPSCNIKLASSCQRHRRHFPETGSVLPGGYYHAEAGRSGSVTRRLCFD
jgi:hypothetical protein